MCRWPARSESDSWVGLLLDNHTRRTEERGKRAYEYGVGLHHDNGEAVRLILFVPARHDHLIEWWYIAEDKRVYHTRSQRADGASHDIT
jgi:hypothetical protein